MQARAATIRVRFGDFEVDLRTPELRKNGARIRLQEQPFQVLTMLLERAGEVVTRDELRLRLWSAETFVDFDVGLNTAIMKLRDALDDSADHPRYIETIPRRGYRFIFPVERAAPAAMGLGSSALNRRNVWLAGALILGLVLVALALWRARSPYQQIQPIRAIAVLPLKNLSGDPSQEYFVDGMTDALITELSAVPGIRVVPFQSTLGYKLTTKSNQQIAREMEVDALLEGSMLRSGDRVRVNLQLVRAQPETVVWSQSLVRDTKDVVSLQGELTEMVLQKMEATLTPEQSARLKKARPVDPLAYDAWLRGNELYNRYSAEWFDESRTYFETAIAIDPNFAPPYAALAILYCADNRASSEDLYPRAAASAAKALKLDDSLPEAHVAEAMVNLRFRWDWAAAERHFQRASQLNSNSLTVQLHYGYYLVLVGRFEEGIAAYRKALRLDPLNQLANQRLGWAYGKAGREDDNIAHLRDLARLDPNSWIVHYELAHAYARKRLMREALQEVDKIHCRLECGWVLATCGRRSEARAMVTEFQRASKSQYTEPGFIAMTYAGLGDRKNAVTWLEKGYRQHSRLMLYMKVMKEFDILRDEPDFQNLMRKLKFPS